MRFSWMGILAILVSSSAFGLDIPVARDASLIQNSLCCGPGAADRNFGAAATVDAGRYHHTARALFGFPLDQVADQQSVILVLPGTTVGSFGGTDFSVSLVQGEWDEQTVTFNSAPASEALASAASWVGGQLRFDVTAAVHAAVCEGRDSISFIVDAMGSTNLFVPSRENASGLQPAFLELNAQ